VDADPANGLADEVRQKAARPGTAAEQLHAA
jgi:hypothetical protein